MPRVAVVVPCYNDGATLLETLASLKRQEQHELVVVDDGSTEPQTLRVLAELEAGGVHVVRQENRGLSAARMAGVAATSAPYVLPVDADDALAPGAVAALADALDADRVAVLAWGDVDVWGEVETRLAVARALDPWFLTYLNDVPVTSLVRRTALLDVGGWSMGSGYEDWDLWLALAERGGRGVHVPRTTLRYRRRSGRMLDDMTRHHAEFYERLAARHRDLFATRPTTRRRSTAPLRAKLLFPFIGRLPIAPFARHRLYLFVNRPHQHLLFRRLRRRAPTSTVAASR
jgi:glycosyltransferase involved in cell wall biosynthesis